jgi:hypothetical protein
MRIGNGRVNLPFPCRRILSRLDERLLSRVAGSRMWFAATTRQAIAYRIQTDPVSG